jgi:hypothetical protein
MKRVAGSGSAASFVPAFAPVGEAGHLERQTADQVKALIWSHADGDDTRFYAIAIQVAAQAARSGHGKFAQGAARARRSGEGARQGGRACARSEARPLGAAAR